MHPSAGPLQKYFSSRPHPVTRYTFAPSASTSTADCGQRQSSLAAHRMTAAGRSEQPRPPASRLKKPRVTATGEDDRPLSRGSGHDGRKDHHDDHDEDAGKEVAHRRRVAHEFIVPNVERSVQGEKLHQDTGGDDAGGKHAAPRPLSLGLEVPESNERE